jgi:hypothetical protein
LRLWRGHDRSALFTGLLARKEMWVIAMTRFGYLRTNSWLAKKLGHHLKLAY